MAYRVPENSQCWPLRYRCRLPIRLGYGGSRAVHLQKTCLSTYLLSLFSEYGLSARSGGPVLDEATAAAQSTLVRASAFGRPLLLSFLCSLVLPFFHLALFVVQTPVLRRTTSPVTPPVAVVRRNAERANDCKELG